MEPRLTSTSTNAFFEIPANMSVKMSANTSGKEKKGKVYLEVKREIIEKHYPEITVVDLVKEYEHTTLTIFTIIRQKEDIKATPPAKRVSTIKIKETMPRRNGEPALLVK